ncbi:MAG TPA: type IIL restriction-modification enzyme MmeI [Candidatus Acidoferrum sp.]|nr:type IIL restriction-modification enzyme MmeI [Candidatus Acidoferrum sp.]
MIGWNQGPSACATHCPSRWSAASASERANSRLFLTELCDVLGVPHPDAHRHGGYAFEFPVPQENRDGSVTEGRIDLYKRGCFVLESKQFHAAQAEPTQLQLAAEQAGAISSAKKKSGAVRGTEKWDDAMFKARGQAERYIRSLPQDEPTPPFLIVVDVGDTFEVYADFTQAGKAYQMFPDPRGFRLRLSGLEREEIRERLRTIWTNPFSLDPARRSAAVTRTGIRQD